SLAAPPAAPAANFAFETGRLTNWEGEGFYLTAAGEAPNRTYSASSGDRGTERRTGILHRTFTVPADAGVIRFTAAAVRPPGCRANADLDVVREAAGRVYLPRQVRTAEGWKPAPELLPPAADGKPREYQWDVSRYAGQRVRIALVDRDERPDCFVVCGG